MLAPMVMAQLVEVDGTCSPWLVLENRAAGLADAVLKYSIAKIMIT